MNPNGGDQASRIQRLEEMMEVLMNRHLDFEQEHRQLLTAQVVLTDNMRILTEEMRRLAEAQRQLAEAQRHTDERMDGLIAVVDDLVRRERRSQ